MLLPLQQRATDNGLVFLLKAGESRRPAARVSSPATVPELAPGEQYRFSFDMTRCIGCHCCEVACNEQNNNPPSVSWRRVGEIEGGVYPLMQRFYLSMGCNHCLQPSCLTGCPVDAYRKDPVTGLVLHNAEACIGCQYCTWNCSYGVPQYNPERGVVGKCDMCHGRLAEGRLPACVNACPQEAIQVEAVNIEEWKSQYLTEANAPGLPAADDTISTTRVVAPASAVAQLERADYHRVRPEAPHWSLVAMTVLTQLSVGAFLALWVLEWYGGSQGLGLPAVVSLLAAVLSFTAAVFHLGRPIYAWRALRMWKRSWLSREVLLFSGFVMCAAAYTGALCLDLAGGAALGAITAMLGLAGVTASAFIYLVPARPAWNSRHTVAEFHLTALALGPLLLTAAGMSHGLLVAGAVAGAGGQLLNQALKFLSLSRSEEFELRASARLLAGELEPRLLARLGLLVAGGIVMPLLGYERTALAAMLASELLGRVLFFVSVVPKNMAASFFASREKAA